MKWDENLQVREFEFGAQTFLLQFFICLSKIFHEFGY